MAITVEDAQGAVSASTVSINPQGSDRVLYVISGVDGPTGSISITVGGSTTGITDLAGGGSASAPTTTAGTGHQVAWWRLIAPSTGAQNVVVTGANLVCAIALSGVDQTTPNDASSVEESASAANSNNLPMITSASGDVVVTGVNVNTTNSGVLALAGTGTIRVDQTNPVTPGGQCIGIGTLPGDTSINAGWTWGAARSFGLIAFNVNQSVAGGPSPGVGALSLAGQAFPLGFSILMPDEP